MIMTIFLKTDKVKRRRKFFLSSGTNKSISNFRETIPFKLRQKLRKINNVTCHPDLSQLRHVQTSCYGPNNKVDIKLWT
jgi:hypothetical protein